MRPGKSPSTRLLSAPHEYAIPDDMQSAQSQLPSLHAHQQDREPDS